MKRTWPESQHSNLLVGKYTRLVDEKIIFMMKQHNVWHRVALDKCLLKSKLWFLHQVLFGKIWRVSPRALHWNTYVFWENVKKAQRLKELMNLGGVWDGFALIRTLVCIWMKIQIIVGVSAFALEREPWHKVRRDMKWGMKLHQIEKGWQKAAC
jgi:hypothetical protein